MAINKSDALSIAARLDSALKVHIVRVRAAKLMDFKLFPKGVLVTYGDLCGLAGNPVIPRGAGKYLTQSAHEANKQRRPPLDCLVVNKKTKLPGGSYAQNERFDKESWISAVTKALRTNMN